MKKQEYGDVLPQIVAFFSLGVIRRVKNAGGEANANFFVTTNLDEFFVKVVVEPYSPDNKWRETFYTAHLFPREIPLIPYLSGVDKSNLYFDGKYLATAQYKRPGYHPKVNRKNIAILAGHLARLHNLNTHSIPCRTSWLAGGYIQNSLDVLERDYRDDPDAKKIISVYKSCRGFEKNVIPDLPKSFIHGDTHTDNLLFERGKLIAFLDWEDSTIAPSLFDFVGTVAYWCFERGKFSRNLFDAFFSAYIRKRNLTMLEVAYMEDCMRYVASAQAMWRFINYNRYRKDTMSTLNMCTNWRAPMI